MKVAFEDGTGSGRIVTLGSVRECVGTAVVETVTVGGAVYVSTGVEVEMTVSTGVDVETTVVVDTTAAEDEVEAGAERTASHSSFAALRTAEGSGQYMVLGWSLMGR